MGCSQDLVSLAEGGHLAERTVGGLRRHVAAVGGELVIELRFRGAELDRMMDEGHAALVGTVTRRLGELGWEIRAEVTFSVWGERGSIDLVAWHAPTATLLVIEVKTELASIEETLRRHDVKVRLAAAIVEERFGWRPRIVGRLLVLPAESTQRRQVRRHGDVLDTAYPVRGAELRAWMSAPSGAMAGLAFVPVTTEGRANGSPITRRRVRRPVGPD